MKRKLVFTCILFLAIPGWVNAQSSKDVSSKFLNDIVEKNWDDAESFFSQVVKQKISAKTLEQVFNGLKPQIGELISFDSISNRKNQALYIGHFTSSSLTIEVNFDDSSKIAGFFFLPLSKLYKIPQYSDESKYYSRSTFVVTDNLKLPAVITLPNNQSNISVPVVIFIGGSGPNDMDESIEAEKPFNDISIGLAVNGIASLRYDKRTYIYHNLPANITIKEEYLIDVKNAIKLAKTIPGIDTSKIFILGHSLGGMLCPLILKENPFICGAILLEANARPLEDLMYDQGVHLSKIGVGNNQFDLQAIFTASNDIKKITIQDTSKTYLNVKGSYWLSLNQYNPIQTALELKNQKLFIIQGGDDYQVTPTDFNLWKKLNKNVNISFKFYPLINHALVEGDGSLSPREYDIPLNSPIYLSNDISTWIKKIKN